MSSSNRRIAVLAASSLVALGVVAVPALATQTVKINSRVTVADNQPAFHGRVKSPNHACEQQRKAHTACRDRRPARFAPFNLSLIRRHLDAALL